MGIFDELFKKHKIQNNDVKELTQIVYLKSGVKTTFDRHFYRFGYVHQADLLYLPEDDSKIGKKAKYLLVVTDIGSGLTDARPLASRSANVVLKAIKDIYATQKYIKEPRRIHVDSGTEFADFPSYFKTKNIGVRIAAVNRHKQGALVEAMNKTIGSVILKLQMNNELASGLEDKEWVSYLPDILLLINENAKKKHPKDLPILDEQPKFTTPLCKDSECDTLMEGDEVRVALDYPQSVDGKRLHGTFRSGDHRWSLKPQKIEKVLLYPNQPIRYVIEGYKNNTFSRAELMPFTSKNKQKMKLTNDLLIIDKLLDKKVEKGNTYFLVKWEEKDEPNSWQIASEIPKEMIDEYDEEHGTKTVIKTKQAKGKKLYVINGFVKDKIEKKKRHIWVSYEGFPNKSDNRWYSEERLRNLLTVEDFNKFNTQLVNKT
jgi:hypothetical protein